MAFEYKASFLTPEEQEEAYKSGMAKINGKVGKFTPELSNESNSSEKPVENLPPNLNNSIPVVDCRKCANCVCKAKTKTGKKDKIATKYPLQGRRKRIFSNAQISTIKTELRSGKSARTLAKKYGVSHTTILNYKNYNTFTKKFAKSKTASL